MDAMNGDRARRGQGDRLARVEREETAVLPTLDRSLLLVDLPLGEGEVLMAAGVVDRSDLVAEADDADRAPACHDTLGRADGQLVEADPDRLAHDATASSAETTTARRYSAQPGIGTSANRSSKNPSRISRSA